MRAANKAWKKYVADVKRANTLRPFDLREELMLWDFTDEATFKQWDCISDTDMQGHSFARFHPNGKGESMTELYRAFIIWVHNYADDVRCCGTGTLRYLAAKIGKGSHN